MIEELALEKLEFSKVLDFISKHCITETGKVNARKIKPGNTLTEVMLQGALTTEAKTLINEYDEPPFDYLPELENDFYISKIANSLLSAEKINRILSLAKLSRKLTEYFKSQSTVAPILSDFTELLFSDRAFEKSITDVINENDEIRDSASKQLRDIRQEIRDKNDELTRMITRIIRSLTEQDFTRENYLTLRDGRFVVPIKAEHKRHIRGFIHSESSTGQTVYIEPEETLQLNNELVSLSFAEKREIDRLLRVLTSKIGKNADFLLTTYKIVTDLDVIFAKAKYSNEVLGVFPTFDEYHPLSIIDGRHPVLYKKYGRKKTIPFNIKIDEKKIFIISGPNAGGKTVLTKSIGLLSIMAQSGIHVPVQADSNFHFFENILVDIGDQQSIEDDLSTFSSHLIRTKTILEQADEKCLVLMDELGTGTEPSMGNAIASAILLTLLEKKSYVICTTHLGDLKLLASKNAGIENAMMEFDTINLIPAYRFVQGVPGSSYAFEIAKRIGFSDSFLNIASAHAQKQESDYERILKDIEERGQTLSRLLAENESEKERLADSIALYNKRLEEINQKKNDSIKKSKAEADRFLRDSRNKIESLIKEIKDVKETHSKGNLPSTKKIFNDIYEEQEKIFADDIDLSNKRFNFTVGDFVKIKDTSTVGEILAYDATKDVVSLSSNGLRIQIKGKDVVPATKVKESKNKPLYNGIQSDSPSYRLDIRGQKPEDAYYEIVRFLDSAYSSDISTVEILHGKGNGVLSKLTQDILKEHPGINKYYFANPDAGGHGITIVDFK